MHVSNNAIYEPSKRIMARLARQIVPTLARRPMRVSLERPIVSFTFDDFPRSAIKNGSDVLETQGWKATFYVAAGLEGVSNHHGDHFRAKDIKALQARGHEFGGHTYGHIDIRGLSDAEILAEIDKNDDALHEMGVEGDIEHFAYPFGEMSRRSKRLLGKRYKSLRGIAPHTHRVDADLNGLFSAPLFSGEKLEHALRLLRGQKGSPGWLTFFTHDIREDASEWGCTPEEFLSVVEAVKEIDALVLPIGEAIRYIEALNDD